MLRTIFVILFLSLPVFAQTEPPSGVLLQSLVEQFKRASQRSCGLHEEAIAIGKRIVSEFADDKLNAALIEEIKKRIARMEPNNVKCKTEAVEQFRLEEKKACGQRTSAKSYGKQILEMTVDKIVTENFQEYVRNRIAVIEKEEMPCRREINFNLVKLDADKYYQARNWYYFFPAIDKLIGLSKNSQVALDYRLTYVKFAFIQTTQNRDDRFDRKLVDYAEDAIERIETGAVSGGDWGAFEGFKSRENTLGWLNYILGYMNYFRLRNEKKGIEFLYRATLYKCEFKYDAFMYQAAAIYYFDKETVSPSAIDVNDLLRIADQTPAPQNLKLKPADRQIDLTLLLKNLGNLYNLRYGLKEDEYVTTFEDYVLKLISRPLIDPSFDEPAKTDK